MRAPPPLGHPVYIFIPYRSIYTGHLTFFSGKKSLFRHSNRKLNSLKIKNLVLPVKMVFLSRRNTKKSITRVYDPTSRPRHNNGSGRYVIYMCLVEYFKFFSGSSFCFVSFSGNLSVQSRRLSFFFFVFYLRQFKRIKLPWRNLNALRLA